MVFKAYTLKLVRSSLRAFRESQQMTLYGDKITNISLF